MTREEIMTLIAVSAPIVLPLLLQRVRALYMAGWRRLLDRIRHGSPLYQEVKKQGVMLRVIHHEVLPNGQKSMRDAINRIETSSSHNNAMLMATFSSSDEAQFLTDPNGKLTWANEAFQQWSGKSLPQLAGRGWLSVVTEQDQHRFQLAFDRAIADGREFRGRCFMRMVSVPTDTSPAGVRYIETDWRIREVKDLLEGKTLIGYSGNVRRRHATGEQPAVRL